jgi:hypothetical protein
MRKDDRTEKVQRKGGLRKLKGKKDEVNYTIE